MMPFHDHDLKNILLDIGVGHPISQDDLLDRLFRDDLIRDELNHFGERLVTLEKKGIPFEGLNPHGTLDPSKSERFPKADTHLPVSSDHDPVFEDLLDSKSSQVIEREDIGPVPRSNGPQVIKPEVFG